MSSQNCNSTHELPRSSFEYPWKQSDFSHYFPCYANKRKAQIPLSPVFYYNLPGKYKKTNLHPAWNKPFHQFPYRSFLPNFPWGHHSRSTVAEQSTDLKYTGKPLPEYPRWTRKRIEDVVWNMLMSGYLNCEDIIDPIVPFEESAEGFMKYVDQDPELSIKMGVTFDK